MNKYTSYIKLKHIMITIKSMNYRREIFKRMWNRMRRQITFNTKIEVLIHNKILPQYVEFETLTLEDSLTSWFSSPASRYSDIWSTLVIPSQKSLRINCLCPKSVPNRFSFTIIYKMSTSVNDFTLAAVQILIYHFFCIKSTWSTFFW